MCLVYKKSKTNEKCPLQFLRAPGNISECLVWFDQQSTTQSYLVYNDDDELMYLTC